jgi:two-component system NtrC family response regulator/two-component system response regulator HydG
VGRREGRFELADGGTLFLDEIGEIPLSVQVKLLRALQQREFERVGGTQTLKVDVRVIAATNRDLAAEVSAGRFREDLYYRLNVVAVTLPPLRTRKGDIPALVSHFIQKFAKSYDKSVRGLLPGTLNVLLRYDWPGNVRELENVIERAVVLARGPNLTTDELPPVLSGPEPAGPRPGGLIPGATFREIEREAILRTLEVVDGSTTRAAEMLGISTRKIQ